MGEVRRYSCTCGYEEELCTGGGMNAFRLDLIQRLFPAESKDLIERQKAGDVRSYMLSNDVGTCPSCSRLHSIGHLNYVLIDGTKQDCRKTCPACDSKVIVQKDIEHVLCPKCGRIMTYRSIGTWD